MKRHKKLPIVILVIGILSLIVGAVLLAIRLVSAPKISDAEYLVQIGQWAEDDAEGVIWNFTSIGEGTLTTNDHINDYKFAWAIEDKKLKIQTDWLYTIDNEYTYELDQNASRLTLTEGSSEINFHPASSIDTEVR